MLPEERHCEEDRERRLEIQEQRSRHRRHPLQAEQHEDRTRDPARRDDDRQEREIVRAEPRLAGNGPRARARASQRADTRQAETGAQIQEGGERQRARAGEEHLGEGRAHAEEGGRRERRGRPFQLHHPPRRRTGHAASVGAARSASALIPRARSARLPCPNREDSSPHGIANPIAGAGRMVTGSAAATPPRGRSSAAARPAAPRCGAVRAVPSRRGRSERQPRRGRGRRR